MSKNVTELSDNTFKDEVLGNQGVVVVDFWAPWCAPCLTLAPTIEKLADELSSSAKICKVNVDDNKQSASEYGVMSIPTLIIFKAGEEKERVVGVQGAEQLMKTIQAHIT